jgi:signal transduction histidine kinase
MSTRLKLFLSYLVMGFIPILLFMLVIVGAMFRFVSESPFLMSFRGDRENIIHSLDKFLSMEIATRDHPEDLFDEERLQAWDTEFAPYHVGIILTDAHGEVFYISRFLTASGINEEILEECDDEFIFSRQNTDDPAHFFGYDKLGTHDGFTVYEKELDEGRSGTFYLVIETGGVDQLSGNFAGRFMTLILIILAGIILLLTYLVTRSMMQSLKKLKDGVQHIAEGDLSFSIKTNKRDEAAQVVMAFEEMRIRLKASIDAQVKEEENRKELISNISHDLKTPVTAIKGYIEGLIDGVADTPEKREKYLSTVLGKTIALDRMIDDLFLYSSLDIGRTPYYFEDLSAEQYFRDLCKETKLDLTERGFQVECDIQIPQGTQIRADRQMLIRLQDNLIENAVKYAREADRKVTFSVYVQGDMLVCATEDNGIGIQPSELPHIFERFYRADAARTSTIGGTGLGLQISKRIIEDHGGRIWAESEPGVYTRISWSIPVLHGEPGHGPYESSNFGGDVNV